MVLKFRVYEQTISLQFTKAEPRQGSKDYLELQFSFSSDWNDLLKYVYIQLGEVSVPHELVDGSVIVDEYFTEQAEFNVTLFGRSVDGSVEVPTNVVTVSLKESNTLWEKDAPEPQNSWFVQVVDARDQALAAAIRAENAAIHQPYPNTDTGTWWVWDAESEAYVDTGEPAHATVTAENIQSALGYTPADSEDVSTKLDKPSNEPKVGKILKVLSINEDGTFTCEWGDAPSGGGAVDDVQVDGTSVVADGVANIPLAKMGSTGVVKFDAFMPFTFNADALRLANADENELTNPRYGFSTNRAITASNYRLAVELAMCDRKGAAWTDAEKTGAWKRLNSIKTTMDEIAVAGAQYYLGEQTAVSVVLPDDAEAGQMVTVSWYNSATAATLSITGTMLSFDYTPSANTRSEINALWDGTYWAVLGNEMEVPSDAETA